MGRLRTIRASASLACPWPRITIYRIVHLHLNLHCPLVSRMRLFLRGTERFVPFREQNLLRIKHPQKRVVSSTPALVSLNAHLLETNDVRERNKIADRLHQSLSALPWNEEWAQGILLCAYRARAGRETMLRSLARSGFVWWFNCKGQILELEMTITRGT